MCKILSLFVNALTGDDKDIVLARDNLLQDIQMHLSEKRKIFSQFFFLHFLNLDSVLTFSNET